MSELKDLTLWTLWEWSLWSREMNPMRVTWLISMRKSLSKWMDSMRFEWIEVNRVNRSEMSDLKDLTWNNPMGMVPMVERDEPYESDLVDLNEKVPIKMNGIDEIWMNWVKWVIWRKWARTTLWESPYELRMSVPMEVTWMNPMRKSLSKWLDLMRFEWIEVNRVNRGKMSELMELT